MRVTFLQRDGAGAPVTGVTHTATAATEAGLVVTPPTVVEISAANAPGWYYFDLSPTGRVVVTTDAGSGVTDDNNRYLSHLVDPDAADTKAAVTEAVWDEPVSGHTTPGTFGEAVDAAPAAADIADAVWDELLAGHTTAGTFGEALTFQLNTTLFWRLLSTTYSGSPARPTSLIVAAYATKADADADINRLYTQTVTQTFDATGQLVTSSKTRI